jgi:hypothetical protein
MSKEKPGSDELPSGNVTVASAANKEGKTPAEWGKSVDPKLAHIFAAAKQLYGWDEHAFHFQDKPLILSADDFAKAMDAAAKYPAEPPYVPAFGARAGERFAEKLAAKKAADEAKAALAKKGV